MSSSSSSRHTVVLCPFTWSLFIGTTFLFTRYLRTIVTKKQFDSANKNSNNSNNSKTEQQQQSSSSTTATTTRPTSTTFQVVFVLGGPGAGKGTQCQLLQERLGWTHLSAGDLLRQELHSQSQTAELIRSIMNAGQLVPSEITVGLLQQAMLKAYTDNSSSNNNNNNNKSSTRFLIDGFPRSFENVQAWNDTVNLSTTTTHVVQLELVLCLSCPEEVLVGRLLERGQTSGRNDDTPEVIRKRFQTFQTESQPIVASYGDKVRHIASDRSVEIVYQEIAALLQQQVKPLE